MENKKYLINIEDHYIIIFGEVEYKINSITVLL